MRLWEGEYELKPVKIRVASNDFRATCNLCGSAFKRKSRNPREPVSLVLRAERRRQGMVRRQPLVWCCRGCARCQACRIRRGAGGAFLLEAVDAKSGSVDQGDV
jgi:hypothetical protein